MAASRSPGGAQHGERGDDTQRWDAPGDARLVQLVDELPETGSLPREGWSRCEVAESPYAE
ncbi:hypothetical protein [Nonomuraea phyllanthi]|uniref:hypothetical protein n=1 Tax=Nonomuraea phyllanthi TaxID=2219224 RepID=UPI00188592D6|nr:hypothetical protein [Nonomuraea phyllanthi]